MELCSHVQREFHRGETVDEILDPGCQMFRRDL